MINIKEKTRPKVALMTYAFDNRQAKGTAVYARQLTQELLKSSDFDFYLVHYEKVNNDMYLHGNEIIMPFAWLPSRWIRQLLFFWKYRHHKFDVMHWFQPRLYPGYWWAPARHKIVTIHGGGKYFYPKFNVPARIFDFIIRYLNQSIDVMIVGTALSKKEARNTYHVKSEKLKVTYYGGGESFVPLDKVSSLAKIQSLFPEIKKEYILNVSRLQPHKNIVRLVHAYDTLRQKHQEISAQLVIVGWPTEGVDDIYEAARQAKYSHDIIFIKYVEQENLNVLYSGASIFVFPSLSEGFGLPVVEAMASGTPVITSNISCLPEVVADAGVVVDPYNTLEIADAIFQLLSNSDKLKDFRNRGIERSKLFIWSNTAKETLSIYANQIQERSLSLNTQCPICHQQSKMIFLELHVDSDIEYSLYSCDACGVAHWQPFQGPGHQWYEQDQRYSAINSNPFSDVKDVEKKLLATVSPGELFDIGCGSGNFLLYARQLGWRVSGIDFDRSAVVAARDFFGLEDVSVATLELFIFNNPNRRFDLITFFDVFEHIDNHHDFLNLVMGILKPGGHISLTMPYGNSFRWLAPHDYPPRHLSRWTDDSLRKYLVKRGWIVESIIRQPATVHYILMKLRFRYGRVFSFDMVNRLSRTNNKNITNKSQGPEIKKNIISRTDIIRLIARAKDWAIFGMPALIVWLLIQFNDGRFIGIYALAKKPSYLSNDNTTFR